MNAGDVVRLDRDRLAFDLETGRMMYFKKGDRLTFLHRGADQDGLDDHDIFERNNQLIVIRNHTYE